MPTTGTTPSPGHIVRVRQRLYLVEETVPLLSAGDSSLVKLSCVDDDAQGQHLEVLWERELDAEVMKAEAWEAIAQRGFDSPSLFSAYLNTLPVNCLLRLPVVQEFNRSRAWLACGLPPFPHALALGGWVCPGCDDAWLAAGLRPPGRSYVGCS